MSKVTSRDLGLAFPLSQPAGLCVVVFFPPFAMLFLLSSCISFFNTTGMPTYVYIGSISAFLHTICCSHQCDDGRCSPWFRSRSPSKKPLPLFHPSITRVFISVLVNVTSLLAHIVLEAVFISGQRQTGPFRSIAGTAITADHSPSPRGWHDASVRRQSGVSLHPLAAFCVV